MNKDGILGVLAGIGMVAFGYVSYWFGDKMNQRINKELDEDFLKEAKDKYEKLKKNPESASEDDWTDIAARFLSLAKVAETKSVRCEAANLYTEVLTEKILFAMDNKWLKTAKKRRFKEGD